MDVRVLGVPTDYGANRRGVDMGPSAIRYAGLSEVIERTGIGCTDGGNVAVDRAAWIDGDPGDERVRFAAEIEAVCNQLADQVAAATDDGSIPLVLGGDHSISIGSLRGTSREADVGVVWLDAHGDFNTPATTPSGNVHGMALAAALGYGSFDDWATAQGIAAENVAIVGLRDLDAGEREALRDSPVTTHTMSDVDRRGITAVVEDALSVATDGTDGLHLSLDLDVLDPQEAPGVGTPVRGGMTYREAHTALELVDEVATLRSLDVVEVNPVFDRQNATAELACELVASALGEQIL